MRKELILLSLLVAVAPTQSQASNNPDASIQMPSPNRLAGAGLPKDTTQEEYAYFLTGEPTAVQRKANAKVINDYRAEKTKPGGANLKFKDFLGGQKAGVAKSVKKSDEAVNVPPKPKAQAAKENGANVPPKLKNLSLRSLQKEK